MPPQTTNDEAKIIVDSDFEVIDTLISPKQKYERPYDPRIEYNKTRNKLATMLIYSFLVYGFILLVVCTFGITISDSTERIFDKLATIVSVVIGFYFGTKD